MDEATLHAAPLAVNDPHASKSRPARFFQICHHDALHVARRDGVKIEYVIYLKADGFGKEVEIVAIVAIVNVAGFRVRRGRRLESSMRGRCVQEGAL